MCRQDHACGGSRFDDVHRFLARDLRRVDSAVGLHDVKPGGNAEIRHPGAAVAGGLVLGAEVGDEKAEQVVVDLPCF